MVPIYSYRLDPMDKRTFIKKKYVKFNIDLKLMQLHFLTLSKKRIKKFARRANLRYGLYESNYLFFLECRLLSLFYRSNLLGNVFEILRFVKKGHVSIGNKYIKLPNKRVNLFCLVKVRYILKGYISRIYEKRMRRKAVYFNIPKYMFFSSIFFSFFILRFPKLDDLVYPFPLDVSKITAYDLQEEDQLK